MVFAIDISSLRLPDFDALSVWHLVYFLIVLVAILSYMQWRLRKAKLHEALANRFMQILMHRDLTTAQNKIIDHFFRGLNDSVQGEILLSAKAFALYLKQYFEAHAEIAGNEKVQIFDKLLLSKAEPVHITSVADLRMGELCALDVGKFSHLHSVLKTKDDMVLLASQSALPYALSTAAQLYAYRPHLGGFLLQGHIVKINPKSFIFKQTGEIQFKGDQHLMCDSSIPLKLECWPQRELDPENFVADAEVHPQTDFTGSTERISDRAYLVAFTFALPEKSVKGQEFWEATLELPDQPISCRVKLSLYKAPQSYLLRLVDITAPDRERLYAYISEHNPVRAHF